MNKYQYYLYREAEKEHIKEDKKLVASLQNALGKEYDIQYPKMPTINKPIFFYHSIDDEIVPFAHLSLYKEKFPHATIRKIDHEGHQLKNNVSEIIQDIKSLYLTD